MIARHVALALGLVLSTGRAVAESPTEKQVEIRANELVAMDILTAASTLQIKHYRRKGRFSHRVEDFIESGLVPGKYKHMVRSMKYSGYVFGFVVKSEGGKTLDPTRRYAMCAVPLDYADTGSLTFLHEYPSLTTYEKNTKGATPERIPSDLPKEGWKRSRGQSLVPMTQYPVAPAAIRIQLQARKSLMPEENAGNLYLWALLGHSREVKNMQVTMQGLEDALRWEKCVFPTPGRGENSFGILMPHLSNMRGLARKLLDSAKLDLKEGKHFRSVWKTVCVANMGAHLTQGPFLIGQLVGMAILNLATDHLSACFNTSLDLTPPEWTAVLKGLQLAQSRLGGLAQAFREERLGVREIIHQMLGRVVSKEGVVDQAQFITLMKDMQVDDETLRALSNIKPSEGRRVLEASLDLHARLFEDLEKWIEKPLWIALKDKSPFDVYRREIKANPLIKLLVPAVRKVPEQMAYTYNRVEGLITAAALSRYCLIRKEYPGTLRELVPGQLAKEPVDLFTGRSFSYIRLDPNSVRLYSVGRDGVDQGGKENMTNYHEAEGKDMVFLSPELRKGSSDEREGTKEEF